jgi:hypothetical protein
LKDGWSGREADASRDAAGLDVSYRLVDVVEQARLADHVRPAGGVQLEDLT